jgi:hypothetical protein
MFKNRQDYYREGEKKEWKTIPVEFLCDERVLSRLERLQDVVMNWAPNGQRKRIMKMSTAVV